MERRIEHSDRRRDRQTLARLARESSAWVARIAFTVPAALLTLAALLTAAGCSSVKPYEKEHLADPIMLSDDDIEDGLRELKWLEAREGSTGGVGGAGGGCACK